jgi:hypothetical protein
LVSYGASVTDSDQHLRVISASEDWMKSGKTMSERFPAVETRGKHRKRWRIVGIRVSRVSGIFLTYNRSIPQDGNLLSMEGSMIDAVVNVAVFATLGLCIVGFGAWAHKRVP